MKHVVRCERCGWLFHVEYIEGLLDQRVTHREGTLLIGAPEACGPISHDPFCILIDQGEGGSRRRWDREEREDELEEIL